MLISNLYRVRSTGTTDLTKETQTQRNNSSSLAMNCNAELSSNYVLCIKIRKESQSSPQPTSTRLTQYIRNKEIVEIGTETVLER